MRNGLLVLTPEPGAEPDLAGWLAIHSGQVFLLREIKGGTASFHSLGPKDDACRLPINITSRSPTPFRLISNFAHAPFVLDGQDYASVEGFWQGLKFPDDGDRRRLASLYGSTAKDAGFHAPPSDVIMYCGQAVRVGTFDHWQLMERACLAKFEQDRAARDALLATGTRPLVHQMRRDSRTIPGAIMAEIWMRIRGKISAAASKTANGLVRSRTGGADDRR